MDIEGDTVVEIYIEQGTKYLIQDRKKGSQPYDDWKLISKKSWHFQILILMMHIF
jgi:hypothetical protein